MRIDIWSDVICPFCWIGKRHLETAVEAFRAEHPDVPVDITWHAFELDPTALPRSTESSVEMLSRKYGMSLAEAEAAQQQMADRFAEVGLEFDWRSARICSTFDAHRLAALAATHGLSDEADEALKKAHFTDGEDISAPEVLRAIGARLGLPDDEVAQLLDGDLMADHVRADIATARDIGVRGVPFFVFNRRLAVSGAQPVEVFRRALYEARSGAARQ